MENGPIYFLSTRIIVQEWQGTVLCLTLRRHRQYQKLIFYISVLVRKLEHSLKIWLYSLHIPMLWLTTPSSPVFPAWSSLKPETKSIKWHNLFQFKDYVPQCNFPTFWHFSPWGKHGRGGNGNQFQQPPLSSTWVRQSNNENQSLNVIPQVCGSLPLCDMSGRPWQQFSSFHRVKQERKKRNKIQAWKVFYCRGSPHISWLSSMIQEPGLCWHAMPLSNNYCFHVTHQPHRR